MVEASFPIPYRSPYTKEFRFGRHSSAKAGKYGIRSFEAESYSLSPAFMDKDYQYFLVEYVEFDSE